jgi:hypothetical protein
MVGSLKQDAQMEDLSIGGIIKMVLKETVEVLRLYSRQDKRLLLFRILQQALSHTLLRFNVSRGHFC